MQNQAQAAIWTSMSPQEQLVGAALGLCPKTAEKRLATEPANAGRHMPPTAQKAPHAGRSEPALVEQWRSSSAEVQKQLLKVMARVAAGGFGGRPHLRSPGLLGSPDFASPSAQAGPSDLPAIGFTAATGGPMLFAAAFDSVSNTTYARIPSVSLETCSGDTDDEDNNSAMLMKPPCTSAVTTLVVRNIPRCFPNEEALQEEWPLNLGYDFLYLPRCRDGKGNLTYAFINFISEAHAQAFRAHWHGRRLARFTDGKSLNVSVATVQGLEANVRYLREKATVGAGQGRHQSQPIILRAGLPITMQDV
mmetsp:Transcript_124536/g.360075  ORF Transcript_124536/g.360075 Transcript_124536/m.360075 type:complete len:306 (-) Transcript_124536:613-1530(-)